MTAPHLLISDLHLPSGPSPLRKLFLRFLSHEARNGASLYILGDLFEVWAGDDIGLREYADEVEALRLLTDSGIPVFFLHGNRDLLIGQKFAQATGVQLLSDPSRVDLGQGPVLLSHGDQYCSDDVNYQRWRRFAHWRPVQFLFLSLPASLRQRSVDGIRQQTSRHTAAKPSAIMDVNSECVREAFERHGVRCLIHGHTHRPAEHEHTLSRGKGIRWVLSDWRGDEGEALSVSAKGVHRLPLKSEAL